MEDLPRFTEIRMTKEEYIKFFEDYKKTLSEISDPKTKEWMIRNAARVRCI